MMPEVSGLDLCRKIRAEIPFPYTYFILLTANAHRHERLQGLGAGADDFLTKPIDGIQLEIAVRTAQRNLSAQESLRAQASEVQRQNLDLIKHSSQDPLTRLRNAGVLDETLGAACLHAAAHDPLSLIRLEIYGLD
jgi:sigma-B regulation protein RsbU (phosphoserine phosphatase)